MVYEDEEIRIFKQLNSKMIMEKVAWEITQSISALRDFCLNVHIKKQCSG